MGRDSQSITASSCAASISRSTSRSSTSFLQQRASITTSIIPRQLGKQSLNAVRTTQYLLSTKAGPDSVPDQLSHKSKLVELGFTEEEAARVISYHTSRKLHVNIQNVQAWLQLLHRHHVEFACQVVSKRPLILTSKAVTAAINAEGIMEWLSKLGVEPNVVPSLISEVPMLLTVRHATPAAVTEWLHTKLSWTSSTVIVALKRHPQLFGYSPHDNLDTKLAWFLSKGFSIESISKALATTPSLFNNKIEHNESQLSAMQGLGLSLPQVLKMVRQRPQLLRCGFSGLNVQTKVHFLTQVMNKSIQELLSCTPFLRYSLFNNIGPRWAFHSLYSQDQPFTLSSKLNCGEARYSRQLVSSTLDEDCISRGLTRLQVYQEFKAHWQLEEGKKWDVGG